MAQLVQPNTSVQDGTGWCLRFTQSVWGAPARYNSAWDAWNATQHKHTDRVMPSDSVPVWFSHYGSYGTPATYGNWGHVVSWIVTEKKFLSSPAKGYGQQWLNSIEEVERVYNSKYVGWSEDINGLRVANTNTPTPKTTHNGETDMIIIHHYETDRYFSVNQQYLYSYSWRPHAEFLAKIINPNGEPIKVSTSGHNGLDVNAILVTYKIPLNEWQNLKLDSYWIGKN
jgi:hypothetical protein